MRDFGNSLDVVKGALIYGRSPYIPLRFASLVRQGGFAPCTPLSHIRKRRERAFADWGDVYGNFSLFNQNHRKKWRTISDCICGIPFRREIIQR